MKLINFNKQNGITLILVLLVLTLAASAYMLSEFDIKNIDEQRQAKTTAALAEAKKVILARMLQDTDGSGIPPRLGSITCPDLDNDGKYNPGAGENCPNNNAFPNIGRLPYQTYDISKIVDGYGESLWLVFKPMYKHNSAENINFNNISNVDNQLLLDGDPMSIIIMSPGAVLPNQDRSPLGINDVVNYFEGENSDLDGTFLSNQVGSNDRFIGISPQEVQTHILNFVKNFVKTEVANALDAFYATNGHYPFPEDTNNTSCDADSDLERLGNFYIGKLPTSIEATCSYTDDSNHLSSMNQSEIIDMDVRGEFIWYAVSEDCIDGNDCDSGASYSPTNFAIKDDDEEEEEEEEEGGGGSNVITYTDANGVKNDAQYLLFFSGMPLSLANNCGSASIDNPQDGPDASAILNQFSPANPFGDEKNNLCNYLEDININQRNADDDVDFFVSGATSNDILYPKFY